MLLVRGLVVGGRLVGDGGSDGGMGGKCGWALVVMAGLCVLSICWMILIGRCGGGSDGDGGNIAVVVGGW